MNKEQQIQHHKDMLFWLKTTEQGRFQEYWAEKVSYHEKQIKILEEEIQILKNNNLVEDYEDLEEDWMDNDGERYEFQGQI